MTTNNIERIAAGRVEARFVRNVEALSEEHVFLVMRDKLLSHSLEDKSMEWSPFSLLRFRVGHSDAVLALMIDAEAEDSEDRELCFSLRMTLGGEELVVEALPGGERIAIQGMECTEPRSFSSLQHPSLGGKRKWRIVLLPLGPCGVEVGSAIPFSLRVEGQREGFCEGVLEIV